MITLYAIFIAFFISDRAKGGGEMSSSGVRWKREPVESDREKSAYCSTDVPSRATMSVYPLLNLVSNNVPPAIISPTVKNPRTSTALAAIVLA